MTVDKARILLVDDNPQNLKVLYETLRDRGHYLLIANDGEKALQLVRRHRPEVVLLDIMMPGMDGFTVCEQLKQDPATANSAVIFLSALDDLEAKVRGFQLGGADYIAKPFQPQEVIARVETHVRITQLERSLEARNRELEGDQARILDAISEGIYGLDAQGNISFANTAAGNMVGEHPDRLIGRDICSLHFTAGDDSPGLSQLGLGENGEPVWRRQVSMRRIDGSSFPAEYRASPRYESGQLQGSVVVFRDISEELASQGALEQARRTVTEQREQLAQASRLSTMGEMAAGFAHEVNQPLTAITNYVSLARRLLEKPQPNRDQLQEVLPKIAAQAHRASEVISHIRGFVQKPAAGRERIALAPLLAECLEFAEVDARSNGVPLELVPLMPLPAAMADSVQVQQVLLNLIRNALEASHLAGATEPVQVSAEVQEQMLRITVRDHGHGLSADAQERLFHPFFTTKSEGMGIGLALCRTLVQAQGGDIGYQREASGISCFWFTLPQA
ncbi:MAG: response regulator [Halomonadaceae bacterium]|nr:MAG: response regulator [Halomonadaceae bacterium]